MPGYLPPVIAAAAVALTYLSCVRPMRRHGTCHLSGARSAARSSPAADLELARTQLELLLLQQRRRAEDAGAHTPGS